MHFVVATDGSHASERALEHALEIADGMDASVTAVYSVEPNVYERHDEGAETPEQKLVIEDTDEAQQRGEAALEETAEFAHNQGIDIETELLYGRPLDAIPEYVDEHDIDGIFVGHRGLSETHEVVGSVAKGLVDRASVPVTIVR